MQVVGENESYVTEFVLTGCTAQHNYRMEIVVSLTLIYTITVVGNGLIVLVIMNDAQLHTPMYFFISNLSIVDICFITSELPHSIANCLADRPVTSYGICITEVIIVIFFAATECLLLMVMAYDRYVAISNPLHYVLVMKRKVCIQLAIISWITPVIIVVIPCVSLPFQFCGHNVMDHALCEFKALFKLLCHHVHVFQIIVHTAASFLLVIPLSFIIFSYVRIVMTILTMHSEGHRLKAFSTCGSHLIVVILFFGSAISGFLLPQSEETTSLRSRALTAFAAIITPMFNPFIYTLKNKQISGALKRMICKKGGI